MVFGNILELLSEDLDPSPPSATNNFLKAYFNFRLGLVISKVPALKLCNSMK